MIKDEKIILDDVDILIILKVDTRERLINLELILHFLKSNFIVNIFLLEVGRSPILKLNEETLKFIDHEYIEELDDTFHMTKYRNYLVSKTSSEIIIHYDVDVIVDKHSIAKIVYDIKQGIIQFGYPYDGRFYNLSSMFKKIYYQTRSLDFLSNYRSCFQLSFHYSLGGIFISNRAFYEKIGCENERIIGWGPDDKDRFYQSIKAGGRFLRTSTPLYHFFHPVMENSFPGDHATFMNNFKEYIISL